MRRLAVALLLWALLAGPMRAWAADEDGYQVTARLTHYDEAGVTYSGEWTRPGTAACSWDIPVYSRVVLPDGSVVTCLDRGRLGSSGWIDVWREPGIDSYGPYATVTVLLP